MNDRGWEMQRGSSVSVIITNLNIERSLQVPRCKAQKCLFYVSRIKFPMMQVTIPYQASTTNKMCCGPECGTCGQGCALILGISPELSSPKQQSFRRCEVVLVVKKDQIALHQPRTTGGIGRRLVTCRKMSVSVALHFRHDDVLLMMVSSKISTHVKTGRKYSYSVQI